MQWFDGITDSMGINVNKIQELVIDRDSCPAAVHGVAKRWYGCMDVRVGPKRKLNSEELMLLNCGVGEDS